MLPTAIQELGKMTLDTFCILTNKINSAYSIPNIDLPYRMINNINISLEDKSKSSLRKCTDIDKVIECTMYVKT